MYTLFENQMFSKRALFLYPVHNNGAQEKQQAAAAPKL